MKRSILIPMVWFSLAVGLGACGPADPTDATATPAPEETTPIETLDTTARLAAIRAEYARLAALRHTNRVRRDSLSYECEERSGIFRFYYRGDTLLVAEREYVAGDHGGGLERYYYRHNTPFFTFLRESSWQFASGMQVGSDGEEYPATRDDVYEVRTYYTAGGQPFRYWYKDYTIYSDRDNPAPDQIPNQASGVGVQGALGPGEIQLVAERDSFDCAALR